MPDEVAWVLWYYEERQRVTNLCDDLINQPLSVIIALHRPLDEDVAYSFVRHLFLGDLDLRPRLLL